MPCADSALRRFDLTLRRQLKLHERLSLQARADFFNIFNHPNFRTPINYPTFSSIRAIDSDAGRIAGQRRPEWRLNPLYQIGGPRSAQLALKLLF
jgi:hypothetical protein